MVLIEVSPYPAILLGWDVSFVNFRFLLFLLSNSLGQLSDELPVRCCVRCDVEHNLVSIKRTHSRQLFLGGTGRRAAISSIGSNRCEMPRSRVEPQEERVTSVSCRRDEFALTVCVSRNLMQQVESNGRRITVVRGPSQSVSSMSVGRSRKSAANDERWALVEAAAIRKAVQ